MNYKNTVNIYSGLLIFLITFTAIAGAREKEMNYLTLEDLLRFNEFVLSVPIDITSDGHWIAYNTQNREQYEGGGGGYSVFPNGCDD